MAFPSQLLSQAPSSEETAKLAAWHLHQLYNLLNHCRFQGPCQVSYYWSRFLVWIVVLHNLPGISKVEVAFSPLADLEAPVQLVHKGRGAYVLQPTE